jgi:hypothetical protein
MSVIGSLLWLVTTARNFSTHGNLLQSAEPITRKLHRPNHRLAISPIRHVGSWRSWKYESAIDATMCGGLLWLLIEREIEGIHWTATKAH